MNTKMARMAARNNADWYCMMFDIHQLDYSRSNIAFLGKEPPPAYHSWMTTLDPDTQQDQILIVKENAYRDSFGIKDSFNCLELNSLGFSEVFTATWIFTEKVTPVELIGWTRVVSADDLILWETAWKQGGSPTGRRQFPDAILERDDVEIWGRRYLGGIDAGVVANSSDNCVGLSNCFGENVYPAAATICANVSKGLLPVVGYERGEDLTAALSCGFTEAGTLRVWNRS